MAAILLDVDGVFHVSGEPIAGGGDAVRRLRANGHRIRFVTNNTTKGRTALAEELRTMGIELDDEELQTTPRAAAQALAGRRVLALTMHAIVGELEGIELVGEDAEAVLIGGADETPESNLVFSYMNLARAFHAAGLDVPTRCTRTAGGRPGTDRFWTPAHSWPGSVRRRH
jgi:ribonucleotide monophosphatase NagD (HAD superfamily)